MIGTLLLLGATGDLAQRFLLPALDELWRSGQLVADLRVIGAGRVAVDDGEFRAKAGARFPGLSYRVVDATDPSSLAAVLDTVDGPVAVYLALPPGVVKDSIRSLGAVGLPPGSRVVLEKPFGENLDGARSLNALLKKEGMDVYRVDHVLAMETTQNLAAFRRNNPVVEQLWNGGAVDGVEICWEETLALEGRAAYYDRAGAVKDVMQNHMVQLLALVAMEEPDDGPNDEADLPRRKLEVMRSVGDVRAVRRARYTAGTLANGREVGDYVAEPGVDPSRNTETFAEVSLVVDRPRWRDTQFVLRAGKALARRRKLVRLNFAGGGACEIGIDGPRGIVLQLEGRERAPLELRTTPVEETLSPYAHVLRDVLSRSSRYAVEAQEAEEGWRVVAPLLAAWADGDVTMETYSAGSGGP
jgi:glucose-6-phosphate 1-dehydrogenase